MWARIKKGILLYCCSASSCCREFRLRIGKLPWRKSPWFGFWLGLYGQWGWRWPSIRVWLSKLPTVLGTGPPCKRLERRFFLNRGVGIWIGRDYCCKIQRQWGTMRRRRRRDRGHGGWGIQWRREGRREMGLVRIRRPRQIERLALSPCSWLLAGRSAPPMPCIYEEELPKQTTMWEQRENMHLLFYSFFLLWNEMKWNTQNWNLCATIRTRSDQQCENMHLFFHSLLLWMSHGSCSF